MSKIIAVADNLYEQKARQSQKYNFAKISVNFSHTKVNRTSAAEKDVKKRVFLVTCKTYR